MRRNDKGFLLKWRRKMLWSFLLLLVAFSGSAYANDYEYAIKEDGTARIVEYSGESDVAVIPSQIDGYKVTEIGETVFLVAPTDRRVRQITLPATVQILSFGAFIGTNLTRMELPEGVIQLGENAFQSISTLESVSLPSTLKSIGSMCFYECKQLKEIVIPDGVERIGGSAFEWCEKLIHVVLPPSVISIEDNVFRNCSKDLMITVHAGSYAEEYCKDNGLSYICRGEVDPAEWKSRIDNVNPEEGLYIQDDIVYVVMENGTAHIVDYVGNAIDLVIPQSLNGHRVTEIETEAFEEEEQLKSVVIPEGVTDIGAGAFSSCISLRHVELPDTVESILAGAFGDCIELCEIDLPWQVDLINNPFIGCEKLIDVRTAPGDNILRVIDGVVFSDMRTSKTLLFYPEGLKGNHYIIPEDTSIVGTCAFMNCDALTEIIIPDTVTRIENAAFSGCTGLTRISIPNEKCVVWERAFDGCAAMEYAKLPEQMDVIAKEVFRGCSALKEIEIPETVTRIEEGAFIDCCALEHLVIPPSVEYIGYNAFDGCDKLMLNVAPDSYAEQYCKENGLKYALVMLEKREDHEPEVQEEEKPVATGFEAIIVDGLLHTMHDRAEDVKQTLRMIFENIPVDNPYYVRGPRNNVEQLLDAVDYEVWEPFYWGKNLVTHADIHAEKYKEIRPGEVFHRIYLTIEDFSAENEYMESDLYADTVAYYEKSANWEYVRDRNAHEEGKYRVVTYLHDSGRANVELTRYDKRIDKATKTETPARIVVSLRFFTQDYDFDAFYENVSVEVSDVVETSNSGNNEETSREENTVQNKQDEEGYGEIEISNDIDQINAHSLIGQSKGDAGNQIIAKINLENGVVSNCSIQDSAATQKMQAGYAIVEEMVCGMTVQELQKLSVKELERAVSDYAKREDRKISQGGYDRFSVKNAVKAIKDAMDKIKN